MAKAEPVMEDFMAALDHSLEADFAAVRKFILGDDKSILDGVKWNSLSLRTREWFATVYFRTADQVQLEMQTGARAGKTATRDAIPDPAGLLKCLGKDRAIVSLGKGKALKANPPALADIGKARLAFV